VDHPSDSDRTMALLAHLGFFGRTACLILAMALPSAALAACEDTASNDCDSDGFSVTSGDCDDDDDGVFPGASETCNGVDDDCDGSTDEGCGDNPLEDASIVGGSTCDTGAGSTWLFLLPALWLFRRDTRSC